MAFQSGNWDCSSPSTQLLSSCPLQSLGIYLARQELSTDVTRCDNQYRFGTFKLGNAIAGQIASPTNIDPSVKF